MDFNSDHVTSKDVLQRELNLSRVTRLAGNKAKRRAVGVAVRPAPVRVIQNVEGLDAELQLLLFSDREVLAQSDIEIPCAGVEQDVAWLDAKGSRRRSRPDGILPGGAAASLSVGQPHTRIEPGRRLGEVGPLCVRVSDQI